MGSSTLPMNTTEGDNKICIILHLWVNMQYNEHITLILTTTNSDKKIIKSRYFIRKHFKIICIIHIRKIL